MDTCVRGGVSGYFAVGDEDEGFMMCDSRSESGIRI